MKRIVGLCLLTFMVACSSNDDINVNPVSINFNFTHSWEETQITSNDFNEFVFTNENGETLSIERLRYVVSEVILIHESGVVTQINEHKLIDVTNDDVTFITSPLVLPGNYNSVSIRFGLASDYNLDDAYPDLNTAVFNVGDMLGGGYHYMQFDGKFLDSNNTELPFNYHYIPAVDLSAVNAPQPEDTSINLNLGPTVISENSTITINMDLYEWFSNPIVWDLNSLSVNLMPNYEAQLLIAQNAASVFSLVSTTP